MAPFWDSLQKIHIMVVPAIALIVILFFVVRFFIGAAKKKGEGGDLGDRSAGPTPFPTKGESPTT
jgi:hypothetical protein